MHGGKWIGVCFIALCGVSCNALADWTGKGEIGASLASGNSENESANAALEVKNTRDKWTHTLGWPETTAATAPSQIQSDGRSAASPTTRSPITPTGSARGVTRTTGSVRSSSRRRSRAVWDTRS